MKIYNSISTKTFTTYVFLILVIKTIIITTNVSALDPNCIIDPTLNSTPPNPNAYIVGFLREQIEPSKIRWDVYTHIIYAYPAILLQSPQSVFDNQTYLNSLTTEKKNAKIIAAIGNYGANAPAMWDNIGKTPYPSFVQPIVAYLKEHDGVDGVDIEYPKTECADIPNIQTIFDNALKQLKDALGNLNKSITVTFGPNDYDFNSAKQMPNIKDMVTFVNIIGYRLNVARGQGILEGPTSPLDSNNNNPPLQFLTFKTVANNWKAANILDPNQLVMGVEFSGIVRKVTKGNVNGLKTSQIIKAVDGPLNFPQGQDIESCDPNKPKYMKSIAWNKFKLNPGNSQIVNSDLLISDCQTNTGWTRIFDDSTNSTYLYNDNGFYISYEDPQSLQYKVIFLKTADGDGKYLGGIMISDISADNNGVLLSIVYSIKGVSNTPENNTTATPTDTTQTSSGSSNLGTTGTDTSTNTPTSINSSSTNTNKNDNAALIGIIIGSIIGAAVIVGGVFLWWNYKRREQMSLNKSVNSNDYQNVSVPVSIIDKAVPATPVSRVTALYDFEGKETTDLSFKKGDIIEVIEKGDGANDWWVGKIGSKIGEFPGNYVRE